MSRCRWSSDVECEASDVDCAASEVADSITIPSSQSPAAGAESQNSDPVTPTPRRPKTADAELSSVRTSSVATQTSFMHEVRSVGVNAGAVMGKPESRLGFKSRSEPFALFHLRRKYSIRFAIRFKNFAIRFEKDSSRANFTWLRNFQTQCLIRVTSMYLFNMWFRFEHEEQKCEDVSSDEAKMCVFVVVINRYQNWAWHCRLRLNLKFVFRRFEISKKIRIRDLTTWFKSLSQNKRFEIWVRDLNWDLPNTAPAAFDLSGIGAWLESSNVRSSHSSRWHWSSASSSVTTRSSVHRDCGLTRNPEFNSAHFIFMYVVAMLGKSFTCILLPTSCSHYLALHFSRCWVIISLQNSESNKEIPVIRALRVIPLSVVCQFLSRKTPTVLSCINVLWVCHSIFTLFFYSCNVIDDQANAWPFCFYSKTGFFGPRTAKSQPIWIKFCTHLLLYGIHLWVDLDRDRLVGGSRPNQNDYVFCNTCNASYI